MERSVSISNGPDTATWSLSTITKDRASMADHPWPRSRKTLGTISGFPDKPRRLGRTTSTARTMRRLVFADGLGCVRATLVGGVCLAFVRGHAKEIRRSEDSARRRAFAFRA